MSVVQFCLALHADSTREVCSGTLRKKGPKVDVQAPKGGRPGADGGRPGAEGDVQEPKGGTSRSRCVRLHHLLCVVRALLFIQICVTCLACDATWP